MPVSPDERVFLAKIIYEEACFWIQEQGTNEIPLGGITYQPFKNGYHPLVCEVIGNIYEDEDLLSGVGESG